MLGGTELFYKGSNSFVRCCRSAYSPFHGVLESKYVRNVFVFTCYRFVFQRGIVFKLLLLPTVSRNRILQHVLFWRFKGKKPCFHLWTSKMRAVDAEPEQNLGKWAALPHTKLVDRINVLRNPPEHVFLVMSRTQFQKYVDFMVRHVIFYDPQLTPKIHFSSASLFSLLVYY